MIINKNHEYFMAIALREARKAAQSGEVPVGAVFVKDGNIIARGYNTLIKTLDPTAHAEIIALRKAAKNIKNYRLNGCSVYVTLEPCPMCAMALVHARIEKLIFGAMDPKTGACGSVFNIAHNKNLNHRIRITSGVRAQECSSLLRSFFKTHRRIGRN
jgi:tRNA(adenine34) deaminase